MAKSNLEAFSSHLARDAWGLGWTVALLPFSPAKLWPKMVRQRVCGSINGFAFRTSLFASADGHHFLLINRAMQEAAKVREGESAEFLLEPDMEARPAALPEELAMLLDEEAGLSAWYEGLSEYSRREIGKWILSVKTAEARLRRAQQMAERLLTVKEAENDLPPLIAMALRRRPGAKAGWEQMTALQRRSELMAVFSYQGVAARSRRVEKLCDAAEKRTAGRRFKEPDPEL